MALYANGYQHRKKITVASGKVSSDLTNFPMLVSHTDADFKSVSNGGLVVFNTQRDFRFEDLSGNKLQHAVEAYNPTTGALTAWVRVPTVSSASATDVYIYYGKTLSTTEESEASVFSDYDSVLHMNGAGLGYETDRAFTPYETWGTSGDTGASGKVGTSARSFTGSSYIFKNNAARYRPSLNMTVSAWVYINALPAINQDFMFYGLGGGSSMIDAFRLDRATDGTTHLNHVKYAVIDQRVAWTAITGQWVKLDMVQSGSDVKYYVNGSYLGAFANSQGYTTTNTTDTIRIGQEYSRGYGPNFSMDEFRKRSWLASAAWIAAEYSNQNAPTSFYSVSARETAVDIDDTSHTHIVDGSLTLVENKTLSVADALHSHTADAPTLTQVHNLVVANSTHSHTADNIVLLRNFVLAVQDTLHAHTADTPTPYDAGTVISANTLHAHLADNIALTQAHTLAVQDTLHSHTVDALVLSQAVSLIVSSTLHAHSADAVILSQNSLLSVSATLHAQTTDNVVLQQSQLLTLQNALHGHLVDNVLFGIDVKHSYHGHYADSITILVHQKIKPRDLRDMTRRPTMANTRSPRLLVRQRNTKPRLRDFR